MKLFVQLIISLLLFHHSTKGFDIKIEKATIKGIVYDLGTGDPLEFATVALYQLADSTLVTGVITEIDGSFEIKKIEPGTYYLVLDFVGFLKKTMSPLSVSSGMNNLGEMSLTPALVQLNEVQVTTEKDAIEYHMDREVINVDQLSSAAGGTAEDILATHPSFQADFEGNISLRGSTNFMILINGKPTALTNQEALQFYPSSSLKRIEIITNPSAKYDAENTSGIINLITKKPIGDGLSGRVSSSYGSNERHELSPSLSWVNDKLSVSISSNKTSYPSLSKGYQTQWVEEEDFPEEVTELWDYAFVRKTNFLRADISYNISDKNTLVLNTGIGTRQNQLLVKQRVFEVYSDLDTTHFRLDDTNIIDRNIYNLSLSNTHEFGENNTLEGEITYNSTAMDRGSVQDQYNSDADWEADELIAERNVNRTQDINLTRFRLDYTHPVGKSILEAGTQIQLNHRTVLGNALFNYENGESDTILDHYRFKRDVYALYGVLSDSMRYFNYKIGLRAELSDRVMSFINTTDRFNYNELSLFPSLNISSTFSEEVQWQFNYTRRIQRPSDHNLNPFVFYQDRNGGNIGNPSLRPVLIHSLELNFIRYFANSTFSAKSYYRRENDFFQYIGTRMIDRELILYTPVNLDFQSSMGMELSTEFKEGRWLKVQPNFSYFKRRIQGFMNEQEISREALMWTSRMTLDVKCAKNTKLQVIGSYNSKQVRAIAIQKPLYFVNTSIRQELLNKNLSLIFTVRDVFNTNVRRTESSFENYRVRSDWDRFSPIYTFTANYKFDWKDNG